jgi:hypothetical protein
MLNFLKQFELPHISTYKWRWLRRVVIVATLPLEVARAIYHTCYCAGVWWKWDGTTPPGAPAAP